MFIALYWYNARCLGITLFVCQARIDVKAFVLTVFGGYQVLGSQGVCGFKQQKSPNRSIWTF